MDIGCRIAERRKELGITQESLAEKLSISPQAVSNWENGWNMPDLVNIHPLAEALKMSVSQLIGKSRSDYEWELRDQLYSEVHMFTRIKTIAEIMDLKETYKALYYMRDCHSGQLRKELKFSDAKVPYIVHPLMMVCHAQSMGITDDKFLAVVLLHDVCEDCGKTPEELPFSDEVKHSVALLTKVYDKTISKQENTKKYYAALSEDRIASVVKVIDRCNNVSTMAGCFKDEKLAEYIDETEKYVFPLLSRIKQTWPEYNNVVFLVKYHMLSVLESLKVMLAEK